MLGRDWSAMLATLAWANALEMLGRRGEGCGAGEVDCMQHACVCLEPLRIIPKSSPIIYIYSNIYIRKDAHTS